MNHGKNLSFTPITVKVEEMLSNLFSSHILQSRVFVAPSPHEVRWCMNFVVRAHFTKKACVAAVVVFCEILFMKEKLRRRRSFTVIHWSEL